MNTQVFPSEGQTIEYKESWRDEYLKWICGLAAIIQREKYVATTKVVPVNGTANGVQLTERQQYIYNAIAANTPDVQVNVQVNVANLATALQVAEKTIRREIYFLRDIGLIHRVGPDKGGHWEVVTPNKS